MSALKTMAKAVEEAVDVFVGAMVEEEVSFDGEVSDDKYEGSAYEDNCKRLVKVEEEITAAAKDGFDNVTEYEIRTWVAELKNVINNLDGAMYNGEIEHSDKANNAFSDLSFKVEALANKLEKYEDSMDTLAENEADLEVKDIIEAHIPSHSIAYAMPEELAEAKKDFVKMTENASLKFILGMLVDELENSDVDSEKVNLIKSDYDIIKKACEKKGTINVVALKYISDNVNSIKDSAYDDANDSAKQLFKVAAKALDKLIGKNVVSGENIAVYVNLLENAEEQEAVEKTITSGLALIDKNAYQAESNRQFDENLTKARADAERIRKAQAEEDAKKAAEEKKAQENEADLSEKLSGILDYKDKLAQTNASLFTKQSKQFKAFVESLDELLKAFGNHDFKKAAEALCHVQDCREAYSVHCDKHQHPHDMNVRNKRVELADKTMKEIMKVIKNPLVSEAYKNAVDKLYKDDPFMAAARKAMLHNNLEDKAKEFIQASLM